MSKYAKAMTTSVVVRIRMKWNISLRTNHPSYIQVYKTLQRTCTEQQEIIEAERVSILVLLILQWLSNLKELVLVFCETLEDEVWVKDYQKLYDMTTQEKSYESYIQLLLAALDSTRDHSIPVHKIQLTCLSFLNDTTYMFKLDDLEPWYLYPRLIRRLYKSQLSTGSKRHQRLVHQSINLSQSKKPLGTTN